MPVFEELLAGYLRRLAELEGASPGGDPEAQLVPLVREVLEGFEGVRVVHEVRTGLGRPDMGVWRAGLLVGFVELKAPGKGADPGRFRDPHDRRQWESFRNLPNLVYTDGRHFALFRQGEKVREVRLAEGEASRLEALLRDFLEWRPLVPRSPEELARFLAPLTRFLREAVLEALGANPEGGLAHLRDEWRETFLPGADDRTFADAYAQLVTYGFLLARSLDTGEEPLYLERALELLKGQYGLLMEALFLSNHPRVLAEIRPAYHLLRRSLQAVDPGAFRGTGADPWLYFYEDFLAAYDPDLRRDMGVYYTPVPVVRAMVRLVDGLLRGGGLGYPLGFAHEGVTVLDPAMGTGTFLLSVLEQALENVAHAYGEGFRGQYAEGVAHRLHGIEIMVGPYAVAQLRLSQALQAEGGSLPREGLNLFLADTLEAPEAPPLAQPFFYERLGEERRRAAELKREKPILVILGNPPYDRVEGEGEAERQRKGGWVLNGPREPHPLMEDFLRPAREAGLGVHLKNLYNLYVYFWRFALWKAFEQDPRRPGVVAFITASSYLQGPGFAGMREHVRRLAHEVYVLDLGGEGRGAVREENVFNIQTPVAIALVVRYGEKAPGEPARVLYYRVPGRTREEKFRALEGLPSLEEIPFQEAPEGWGDPFVPGPSGPYARLPKLTDLFPWQHSGVQFKRTWPIGPTREVLEERWRTLLLSPDGADFFREDRDRKVSRDYPAILGRGRLPAIARLGPNEAPEGYLRYGYRSFDRAWAIVDGRVCSYPRPPLWRVWGDKQVYLTSLLTKPLGKGPALTATAYVPDLDHFSGRGGKDVVPLYRDRQGKEPNITKGLLELLERTYGFPVSPEDFLAYVYALLACPAYTERFSEELRTPGPRVPITKDPDLFKRGVELGSELLWLHTYGERYGQGRSWSAFRGRARWAKPPASYPEGHRYDEASQTLHVGDGEVHPVSPEVYNFQVSGFFPLRAWLEYRQRRRSGRRSSPLDDVVPHTWTADLGRELLELIWVLERTVELCPEQGELMEAVLGGELFLAEELPQPGEEERREPQGEGEGQDPSPEGAGPVQPTLGLEEVAEREAYPSPG
ncbi:MAG: type ISP restriction/modification enzyme [Thermus sp.]|uniref:type ISP restriction/modification enzyme n=1 Tax=Thermus TaxID=270 RepID=UPI001FA9F6C2|nr:type ISP restriction/modification enzyme [Thermus neutrinimicus]